MTSTFPDGDEPSSDPSDASETDAVDALVDELVDDAALHLTEASEIIIGADEIAEEIVTEAVVEALDDIVEAAEELADAVESGELTEEAAEAVLEAVIEAELEEVDEAIAEADALVEVADEVALELLDEAAEEIDVAVALESAEAAAEPEVLSEDEMLAESMPPTISPYDRSGAWFVVHTQSGYEKKVKQNLEARTQSMNMEERIHEVVIPMEDVVEFKNGKKVVVQKKMFPGYLLVRCELDDDSWYVIRNTPGVTGFVGQGAKPSPLPRKDVESFLQVKPEGDDAPRKKGPRIDFEVHETVQIKEGPFSEFNGEIIEINEEQLRVKVLVNIFGRETPVELEFAQITKL